MLFSFLRRPLIGVIDFPEPGEHFRGRIRLKGWVLSRKLADTTLAVLLDGQPVAAEIQRQPRPDVLAAYPWADPGQPQPGFTAEVSTESIPLGRHEIEVQAEAHGRRMVVGRREIRIVGEEVVPSPLLFIHIPKTAGTSLTTYLEKQYPNDTVCLHAENLVFSRPERARQEAMNCNLMSAHLVIETLDRYFDTRRFKKLTVFRRPERQLISHLAWIRRLGDLARKAELARHPEYIQEAVRRLDRLGTVAFLQTLTVEENRLLDNCQSRYLLPQGTRGVTEDMAEMALQQLAEIDLVGITEKLDDFLLLLAYRMGWEPPREAPRVNTGSRKALEQFENEEKGLDAEIARLTRLDRIVYAAAEEKFNQAFGAMLRELGFNEDPDPDREILRKAIVRTVRGGSPGSG